MVEVGPGRRPRRDPGVCTYLACSVEQEKENKAKGSCVDSLGKPPPNPSGLWWWPVKTEPLITVSRGRTRVGFYSSTTS